MFTSVLFACQRGLRSFCYYSVSGYSSDKPPVRPLHLYRGYMQHALQVMYPNQLIPIGIEFHRSTLDANWPCPAPCAGLVTSHQMRILVCSVFRGQLRRIACTYPTQKQELLLLRTSAWTWKWKMLLFVVVCSRRCTT